MVLFNTTTTSQAHIAQEQRKTWRKIIRSARIVRVIDSKLVRFFRRAWLITKKQQKSKVYQQISTSSLWKNSTLKVTFFTLLIFAVAIFVTVPFSVEAQAVFISLILLVAYSLRRVEGQMATIAMITLSVTTSTRYLWCKTR